MRHLSDTGKQIEEHLRQTHPGVSSLEKAADDQDAVEDELALEERPEHPVAALGAGAMAFVALLAALVLTPLFFVSVVFAIPATLVVGTGLGIWAFWSWEKRRRGASQDSGAKPV